MGIEAFEQLSVDEKLEKYPLGTATPLSRYLFMVQLEGCSLDQRKTILNIFEEKGEITDKELSEVMGTEVELSDWKLQPIAKQCESESVRAFRPDRD